MLLHSQSAHVQERTIEIPRVHEPQNKQSNPSHVWRADQKPIMPSVHNDVAKLTYIILAHEVSERYSAYT